MITPVAATDIAAKGKHEVNFAEVAQSTVQQGGGVIASIYSVCRTSYQLRHKEVLDAEDCLISYFPIYSCVSNL